MQNEEQPLGSRVAKTSRNLMSAPLQFPRKSGQIKGLKVFRGNGREQLPLQVFKCPAPIAPYRASCSGRKRASAPHRVPPFRRGRDGINESKLFLVHRCFSYWLKGYRTRANLSD